MKCTGIYEARVIKVYARECETRQCEKCDVYRTDWNGNSRKFIEWNRYVFSQRNSWVRFFFISTRLWFHILWFCFFLFFFFFCSNKFLRPSEALIFHFPFEYYMWTINEYENHFNSYTKKVNYLRFNAFEQYIFDFCHKSLKYTIALSSRSSFLTKCLQTDMFNEWELNCQTKEQVSAKKVVIFAQHDWCFDQLNQK